MAIKVGMVSLGCSKNQVDAEIILAKLRERGYQIHTDSGTATWSLSTPADLSKAQSRID